MTSSRNLTPTPIAPVPINDYADITAAVHHLDRSNLILCQLEANFNGTWVAVFNNPPLRTLDLYASDFGEDPDTDLLQYIAEEFPKDPDTGLALVPDEFFQDADTNGEIPLLARIPYELLASVTPQNICPALNYRECDAPALIAALHEFSFKPAD